MVDSSVEREVLDVMQDDIGWMLRELGLEDHARPISPHAVVADLIIPEIKKLRNFKHAVLFIQQELRTANAAQSRQIDALTEGFKNSS